MGKTAYLVRHTHWDREWYLTQEQFRTRLVRLVDELLDDLDADPGALSFMLDGQAIVLEDYLEVKPWNHGRLTAAIQGRKIVCGPWYVLPDELLMSGEGHIRNFLAGRRLLAGFGSGMDIAYLPDSFGHPAQMPQIVAGLGMDTMLFWRGMPNRMAATEFYWDAPGENGHILCVHMPHGYGNSAHLAADLGETLPRMEHLLDSLGRHGTTDALLLMNGSDHITGQRDVGAVLKALNEQLEGFHIKPSTLEDFVAALRPQLPPLEHYRGELCSGERSMLLGGTISARMPLKQANSRVLTLAERYAEPLLAAEKLLGGTADGADSLPYLWKRILENSPHDSICGCGIDEIHREMVTRFERALQLEVCLLEDAAGRIARQGARPEADGEQAVLVFEPVGGSIPEYAELEIGLDPVLVQKVNYTRSVIEDFEDGISHPPLPENVEVLDEDGNPVPHVVLGREKAYRRLYQDHTMPEVYKVNQMRLGLLLKNRAPGLHKLRVRPADGPAPEAVTDTDTPVLENEFYRLRLEGASLEVLDKKTGRTHANVAQLVDMGDAGDEYSYSWPEQDRVCMLEGAADSWRRSESPVCSQLEWRATLRLPKALTPDRRARADEAVDCPASFTARLYPGLDRIDFTLDFENNAEDHRLQVRFPAGVRTEVSESYSTFHIMERPVEMPVPADWMEYPQNTHVTHGFVALEDGGRGVCVSADGLTEFEAVQTEGETALCLTLLRSVGWLSRTDLATRKGNGGWTIATPEAQCLGRHRFAFSARWQDGGWRNSNAFAVMEKHRLPAFLSPQRTGFDCPNPLGFLEALPGQVRISAVKPAEAGDGVIARFYNLDTEPVAFTLPMPQGASAAGLCNLAESWQADLAPKDGRLSRTMNGCEIQSLYLKC
ncbi:hypothetical protein LJC60_09290 [Ruminococcaceae bacterium OttesenSCG-928-D13]|nr:hypothetical protein [Ruminococcaceae bacterium OttesenSCG-928-D13]